MGLHPDNTLTPRETEVINLLADGSSNAEIAVALAIGVETVKRHVTNILNKTGLDSRLKLAIWWIGQGAARIHLDRIAELERALVTVSNQRDNWKSWFAC